MIDETVQITLTKADFEILLISAFRYALGRSSYVPSAIADIILDNKEQIRRPTLRLFVREIEERKRIGLDSLGMSVDIDCWLSLQERLREYILGVKNEYTGFEECC